MVYEFKAIVTNEIPTVTSAVRIWHKKSDEAETNERAFIFGQKMTEDNALLMLYTSLGEMLNHPEPLETNKRAAPKRRPAKEKKDEG